MNYTDLVNHSASFLVNYLNASTTTLRRPATAVAADVTAANVILSSAIKSTIDPQTSSFVRFQVSPPPLPLSDHPLTVVQSATSSSSSSSSSAILVNNSGSFNPLTNTPQENELGLLWLPYFVFTVVLLFLIALSFVRFHCQRGEQYRKRQAELEDKPPGSVGGALLSAGGALVSAASGGGAHVSGGGGAVTVLNSHPVESRPRSVPDHMSLFVQFTQAPVLSSPINASRRPPVRRSSLTFKTNDSQRLNSASAVTDRLRQKASSVDGDGRGDVTAKKKNKKRVQSTVTTTTSSKRPLLFTFNVNGSMVDIRCGEEERANTFRLNSVGGETCSAVSVAPSAASTATSTAALTAGLSAGVVATRVVAVDETTQQLRRSRRPRDVVKSLRPRDVVLKSGGMVVKTGDVVKSKRPRDVVAAETQMNYYRNQKQLLLFNANNLLAENEKTSYRNDSSSSSRMMQAVCSQNIRHQRDRDNAYPTTVGGRWSGMKRSRDSGSEDEALLHRQRPS